MRGKEDKTAEAKYIMGITPAYAGKSRVSGIIQFGTGDHPRLCGEKSFYGCCVTQLQGSPPPMRGKALTFVSVLPTTRITPAYAGKSLFLTR